MFWIFKQENGDCGRAIQDRLGSIISGHLEQTVKNSKLLHQQVNLHEEDWRHIDTNWLSRTHTRKRATLQKQQEIVQGRPLSQTIGRMTPPSTQLVQLVKWKRSNFHGWWSLWITTDNAHRLLLSRSVDPRAKAECASDGGEVVAVDAVAGLLCHVRWHSFTVHSQRRRVTLNESPYSSEKLTRRTDRELTATLTNNP